MEEISANLDGGNDADHHKASTNDMVNKRKRYVKSVNCPRAVTHKTKRAHIHRYATRA